MKRVHQSQDQSTLPSHATKEYNDDGTLRRITYGPSHYVEHEYDCSGNKTKMLQYQDGVITTKEWLYDERNFVKEILQDGTVIAQFEYTEHGNISRMIYPQSDSPARVIRYGYSNDHSGMVAEILDVTDDANPMLIRKYCYNNDGVLTSLLDYREFYQGSICGNATEQSFSFDSDGRLRYLAYTDKMVDGSGNVTNTILRESYDLKYNDSGNIAVDVAYANYGVPTTDIREYEYDNSNRLARESMNGETIAEYTFDSNGNRKTLTTNTCTLYYDYNEINELTRIARDPNFTELVTTFTYDDRGNQTTETDVVTSTVTTYEYDPADRLARATRQVGDGPAMTLASYWYDGDGQRVKKVIGSTTTRYYYDGLNLLYTDDGSQRTVETIMEPDGSVFAVKRVTDKHAGSYCFLRKDVRGSVTMVVDEKGFVASGYDYDAYGRTGKTGDAGLSLSLAYTGAAYDEETGLYYMNARYYDPKIGRFLTKDNYQRCKNIEQYNYSEKNPTNYIDISGHCPHSSCVLFHKYTGFITCPLCGWLDYPRFKTMVPIYKKETKALDTMKGSSCYISIFLAYYYKQGDYPKTFKYGTNKDGSLSTFKESGCFPSSLAMIASTYERDEFTPAWVVHSRNCMKFTGSFILNFCKFFKYKTSKESVKFTANIELARLDRKGLDKLNEQERKKYFDTIFNKKVQEERTKLKDALKDGNLVLKHISWPDRDGGHFVMLLHYRGRYFVFDPGWSDKKKYHASIPINEDALNNYKYDGKQVGGGLYWALKEYWVIEPRVIYQKLTYR